jgi:3-methyladenine DNA glycosylase AlkC
MAGPLTAYADPPAVASTQRSPTGTPRAANDVRVSNQRRGARRPDLVTPEILRELEGGAIETANLMEQIALSQRALASSAFPGVPLPDGLDDRRLLTRMRSGGSLVLSLRGLADLHALIPHQSDTVRAWAAMAVGEQPLLPLDERLRLVRPFALDQHFAVREWAWISLRPHIIANLTWALASLQEWVSDASPYARRFAVEGTRPRSVWGAHIRELKDRPELGLSLIEPVADDPERYVQDAVSNWLNDAAKTRPMWVTRVCEEWASRYPSDAAARMRRRALRSIKAAEEA